MLLVSSIVQAQPPITGLTFTPDSKQLIVGSQAQLQIREWPSLTLVGQIDTQLSQIHDIAFSSDGKHFVAVGGQPSEFGEIEVHAWPGGNIVTNNAEHEDTVQSTVWHDSETFTTVAADTRVITWRLHDAQLEQQRRLTGHSRRVLAVTHIHTDDILVTGGVDHSLRIWSPSQLTSLRVLDNHTDVVRDLAVRPGSHAIPYVASASADRTVRFWQPTIGRLVRFTRLESEPLSIAWSPNGELIGASCIDGVVRIIDANRLKVVKVVNTMSGWAYEIAAAPDGSGFAVGGEQGALVRVVVDGG